MSNDQKSLCKRFLKRAGAAAFVITLLGIAVSLGVWSMVWIWSSRPLTVITLQDGCIHLFQRPLVFDGLEFTWAFFEPPSFASSWQWLVTWEKSRFYVIVPLYPFALIAALVTIICWHHIPPGHCQKCGYNLTGNMSGICPECGTPCKPDERAT